MNNKYLVLVENNKGQCYFGIVSENMRFTDFVIVHPIYIDKGTFSIEKTSIIVSSANIRLISELSK